MLLALYVFIIVYVLISLRSLGRLALERPAVALLGAAAMVLLGAVPAQAALASIDVGTLLLLVGMMVIVAVLEATGLFAWTALYVVEHSGTPRRLLWGVGIATAVLSALVLNDAVVLFFTPILIHACRRLGVPSLPFLVTEAFAANIGSVATAVGNPQNAYIALASGITYARWLQVLGPLSIICLLLCLLIVDRAYHRRLTQPLPPHGDVKKERQAALTNPRLLRVGLVTVAALFAAFLFSHRLGQPLSLLALSAAAILAFSSPLLGGPRPRLVWRRVDWSIIILFIGLFIVVAGAQLAGIDSRLIFFLDYASQGAIYETWGLGAVAAVLSNLVSNVPATLLLAPTLEALHDERLWFTLAASTTLSGNATILGAAANIIVAERAEEEGVAVAFWDFAKVGLVVTATTLIAAFAWIEFVA